jgi:hypothetical protein
MLGSYSNFGYEFSTYQEQFPAYDISSGCQEKYERGKKYDSGDEHNFLGQLTETVHMFIMFRLLGD